MTEQNWYTITNVEELDTPALVVYPARVKQNIDTAINMIGDVSRLRPHAKTYKNREVTLMMIAAGITKFKCATIAEAEMLAMCGAPNVLLAYQPVADKINRLGKLIFEYTETTFSCLVDHIVAAEQISNAAFDNETKISVYIDLNIGQNRTGIAPDERALQLYVACNKLPGIEPVGLHAYDGHIHGADLEERTATCNAGFKFVEKLKGDIMAKGLNEPIIVAGGSPTFPIHAQRTHVECSPGTFVYWDRGYQSVFKEQEFLTAALVVSRVISLPAENLICLDAGHKSMAPENELSKRIFFLNAPELVMVGQSEEHLVAHAGKGHKYEIGDVLYGLPQHICPTVSMYERAVTIEDNRISGEWKNIARDRTITI